MSNFLHTFHPERILVTLGPVDIYWYGFFMVIAILIGLYVALKLAKQYEVSENTIIDLAFYLVIFGLIGARVYDVFLELPYYLKNPVQVFQIWKGGLAIHGGVIGSSLALYVICKRRGLEFVKIGAILIPGLALGQAVGRWGNYFNQELFGLPTNTNWGIPINIMNRPIEYVTKTYFHPTFLYESVGCFVIFLILLGLHRLKINSDLDKKEGIMSKYSIGFGGIVLSYLTLYSFLRFFLEFVRIDYAPTLLGLRWPQIMSLLIICISYFGLKKINKKI